MSYILWRLDTPERFIEQIRWTCNEDENGCWIWVRCPDWKAGRPRININGNSMNVARWVLWAVTGELHEIARHKCDVKCCCNPEHLIWGSKLDNTKDRVERNPRSFDNFRGSKNVKSKLTEDEIKEIRLICVPGSQELGYKAIASKYGVSRITITRIVKRESWKHID